MSAKWTHALEYEQRDGSYKPGFMAYTESEARGVAKEGRKRTGRNVRVVRL